jgi:hypothetical protein
LGLLGFRLALILGAGTGQDPAAMLDDCRLVAVEPAGESAVLATPDDLVIVHSGDDAPSVCGAFLVVAVQLDRLVLRPAEPDSPTHEVWLPVVRAGEANAPNVVRRYAAEGGVVPGNVAPPVAWEGGSEGRRLMVEKPPP